MKEEARILARQTASGSKDKVGGNQEVGDVNGINLASDSGVVPGRAGVFEDSAAIRSEPDETEDSGVQGTRGGAEVVDGEQSLRKCEDFSEMGDRVRGVADSNDGGGEQSKRDHGAAGARSWWRGTGEYQL